MSLSPLTYNLVSVLLLEIAKILGTNFVETQLDVLEYRLSPFELIVKLLKALDRQVRESAADSGKSTCTPTVNKGAVTIKIISKTNITSTKGVTLISLMGSFDERFKLKTHKL